MSYVQSLFKKSSVLSQQGVAGRILFSISIKSILLGKSKYLVEEKYEWEDGFDRMCELKRFGPFSVEYFDDSVCRGLEHSNSQSEMKEIEDGRLDLEEENEDDLK